MRVLVVIVNYRTADLSIDCLKSMEGQVQRSPGTRVVVVDNASGDGSVEKLKQAVRAHGWEPWVSIMPLVRNGGFAFGNNAAVRALLQDRDPPDLFFFLNPDTVTRTRTIEALIQFMETRPRVGISGSRLEDPDGHVACSAHRFPSPWSELNRAARLGVLSRLLQHYAASPQTGEEPSACHWVSGAAMMVRREVFEAIGLFDEGYFLYFEESDLCFRARQAAWEIWVVPDSRVVHLEGAATRIGARQRRRAKYWYDSRRRFFVKGYGLLGLLAADLLWAMGRSSLLLRRALHLGGDVKQDPKYFSYDLLWGDLVAVLTGRVLKNNAKSP